MLINCSLNGSYSNVDTDNNSFKNSTDSNTQLIFNEMCGVVIYHKNNNIFIGGLLSFVKEIHNCTNYNLKTSKDFTDILRMLKIIDDASPISINNEIYAINGMNLSDLFYIIENNQDNITSGLRKFIRKKKMEKIMTNA